MATRQATRLVTRLGVCNLCEAICGLELTIEGDGADARVTSIRGNPADPLSRGYICPKGVALADVHVDPDRLRSPVRRVGAGADARWVEIGWDEALDRVADGLARAINEHGRDAIGLYLGNPNVHALGAATHGLPLVKMLRTRNRFSASSVDQIPHQLVAWQLYGHQLLLPIPDIDRTSYFLVFGANPMASNGSLMTAPDFPNRLRALKARGGRMVVVDPRRTETAKVADEHLFIRPGADAWSCWPWCAPVRRRARPVRRRTSTGSTASASWSSRSRPTSPSGSAASPPTTYVGSRASWPRPTAAWRTAGSACRPQASARLRSGASSASTS